MPSSPDLVCVWWADLAEPVKYQSVSFFQSKHDTNADTHFEKAAAGVLSSGDSLLMARRHVESTNSASEVVQYWLTGK